jgi:hypothetical protein
MAVLHIKCTLRDFIVASKTMLSIDLTEFM